MIRSYVKHSGPGSLCKAPIHSVEKLYSDDLAK